MADNKEFTMKDRVRCLIAGAGLVVSGLYMQSLHETGANKTKDYALAQQGVRPEVIAKANEAYFSHRYNYGTWVTRGLVAAGALLSVAGLARSRNGRNTPLVERTEHDGGL